MSGKKTKPVCKYGAKCYQTNPHHLTQYSHPTPECKYGEDCTDTTTPHRAKYSHPDKKKISDVVMEDDSDSENLTAVVVSKAEGKLEEEDEKDEEVDSKGRPACSFGKYCMRTNNAHHSQFAHPRNGVTSIPEEK